MDWNEPARVSFGLRSGEKDAQFREEGVKGSGTVDPVRGEGNNKGTKRSWKKEREGEIA